MPGPPQCNPGEILLGKYRVEEVIGVGGMGRVLKASHLYLQQPVAIKILLPNLLESKSTVERFLREAQSTVRLRSEHIARVMDVGTMPDGTPYMVMEFLEGHDLNQILRHHGPQMPAAVVDMILQACEGIAEAHAIGIVHRDIKPSNFFITRRPDGSNLLKILDFGISKTPAEITELTGTQTVIGTPTYMAPEQMRTAKSTDPRSDIWSIGVVMYQMLAGRPPYEAETYAELVLKVGTEPPAPLHVTLPPGLSAVVSRCLEKDPKARIQNVGELARMLAPYASDPFSAQHSAERANRILASPRGAQPGLPLGGSASGLAPPALTPKSWSNTNGSSVSGGAGQIGARSSKSRSFVIVGIAGLVVVAGVGGFVAANAVRSGSASADRNEPHVSAPAPTIEPAATPAPVASPTPTVGPVVAPNGEPTRPVETRSEDVKAKPSDVKAKPVDVTAKPSDVKAKPVDVNAKPVDVKAKPVDVKAKPVDATAKPVDVKAKPVDVKAKPVDVKAKPVDVKAKPVDVKAKPVDRSKVKKPKGDDLFDDRH